MSTRKYDKRSLSSLIKRVAQIDGMTISTGFFDEDRYGPENDNQHVATIAWYNERGLGNLVPSRPFMEKTFSDVMDIQFYARGFQSVFTEVLDKGRLTRRKMEDLGRHVQGVMQMNIADWSTPPNSERWAAIKGRNDPLVFTGKMLSSVKYKVERKNA